MKFGLIPFKKKKSNIKGLECLNCGHPLYGNENFCPHCGQKNSIKKLSFGVFIDNLVSGLFSYDSRFWRTFIPLLTKPGKVSKDYISGKRVRFVNPFQLYLNVSIIFFLIIGISNKLENKNNLSFDDDLKNLDTIPKGEIVQTKIDSILDNIKEKPPIVIGTSKDSVIGISSKEDLSNVFSLVNDEVEKASINYVYHTKRDSVKKPISLESRIQDFNHFYKKNKSITTENALDSLGYEKSFTNKFLYQQVIKTRKNYEEISNDNGKNYIKTFTSYISISLFIFLPLFTLFLMLVYIRKSYTYMEHLVFVFHTQTVFFLLFIIFYVINLFVNADSFTGIFIVLFLLYLYKALRNFYGQSRLKTIAKFIIINGFYLALGSVGLLIVLLLSFFIG